MDQFSFQKIAGRQPTELERRANGFSMCNCVGPQNGEPQCPCAMRDVRIVDGRYVRVQDLGPANEPGKG